MMEKNRNTLRRALDHLPEHAPPPGLWSGLERQLEPTLAGRLPAYQPPPAVWNQLAEQLREQPVEARPPVQEKVRKSRVGVLRALPGYWVGIAATLLLLLSVGYGYAQREAGPKITYAHGQEAAPASPTPDDWNDDESSFTTLLAQLDDINEPALNTMRMELEELTLAKAEVLDMLLAYGDDPQIVRQLAAIERERSDVYRRIIGLL